MQNKTTMSKALFDEFDSVSAKQWKQKIQVDLKGADYNSTLIWKSNEGIDVKPFYHSDDFKDFPDISNTKATQWKITQHIFAGNAEKANTKAREAIKKGADAILFEIPNPDVSPEFLLKDINSDISLYFTLDFLDTNYVKHLKQVSKNNLYVLTDIIGNLSKKGNWFNNLKEDFNHFEEIVKHTHTISVDTALYQNAGANITQQMAYALAHVNEYFNHLDHLLSETEKSNLNVVYKVAVGSNYFFEISKIKALKVLHSTLSDAYGINPQCHIFATPTKRNKTIYDYNTNLLRTTTECMSAILGGANAICNLPYDAIYHKVNDFGERISRNQLLVLKHESYFDKVNNPTDGAYYIETLTEQIAEKALELFKNIEKHKGFLNQLKDGTIQRKIKENANKEQLQFDKNELILLGTNKHPNPNDKMKNEIELYPFMKKNPRKTLIEPIIEKRLAEFLEQERLKKE